LGRTCVCALHCEPSPLSGEGEGAIVIASAAKQSRSDLKIEAEPNFPFHEVCGTVVRA